MSDCKRPLSVYKNTASAMENIQVSLYPLVKFVLHGRIALYFLLEG